MLNDNGTYIHSAGPLGMPGGWPARIWADRLELVEVPGLDVDAAMAMAMAGQRKGGIEAIESDGTVVATETCREMMRDLFDVDVTRIAPQQVEDVARQLRAAFDRRKTFSRGP